ncbi:NAD(P)H-quinone oxidoreductase subunit 4 [Dolichospermum sp. UHCC 0684]|uniref:NAD(P)H-quinone oxidoreductase subunit 4 n=1 Tax=Nostocales TaxID=1161 RepID=UPI00029B755B|nr:MULTISPECIES: NAD(P)H-quinone oxidoreductase subunit 4 [Nostocales]MBO1050893.1 NAD(P)H-quinone oxidoreductase subunit 4 [Dolichospermum sp. DET73]AFW96767.1 proton-translocating NADH-quinone oxidoreductase chain M [Anabaena sp. 90]MEA5528177.1 NAD(P)H-quinone oxidoreductase subunit 4 [Dolichospermum sp. UHCC 0684]MTJ18802.1 NAD(P)H-quinone oxidoreductase subunit 4 [Dolichospermum sp. UHCC 0299]MTJ21419.1 NAD(P)H-quinone oxidoreductase subunit 4 [Dolichospermum sp. UHCC 0352]
MIAAQFPWLTAIVLFPLLASFVIPVLPDKDGKLVRWYALGVGIADFILMCYAFWKHYDASNAGFQLVENYVWMPQIGLNWAVSVDGISAPLVLLAGFVTTLAIFSAWQVDRRPKLFYFLMLVLYSAQVGVFVAQDLLLFFIMWEVELIPVYLLVCIWGGQRRRYAATKFLLYTAAASIFILVAALAMGLYGGGNVTFDIAELAQKEYPLTLQLLLYAGLLIAFGVKLAIFPLHTWLPDAHGEASSPVSMILAGVLLKMGGYGLIRLNLDLLADAHFYFAPVLVILGVVNIIYGALNSFAQTNMKRRLAYSSISHMGFVLIGIASFTDLGINGAMLQMISHGLIASVLFFLAGVTYDRSRTMVMLEMGGIGQAMPKVFALFTMGAMASLALPGMSGFVGELSVFVGITTSDVYTSTFCTVTVFLAAVGVILTPIYLLSMLRQVFYGSGAALICDINNAGLENQEDEGTACFGTDCLLPTETVYTDARPREVFIAACFLVLIIGIGFYPKVAMQMYDAKTVAVNAHVRQSYTIISQTNPRVYASGLLNPQIPATQLTPVLGTLK